jgi:hypothetical protein
MADHLITLPEHFQSVQSREPGYSRFRHMAASLVNAVLIASPGKIANPQAQVSRVYEDYTGQPDIPANTNGLTKEQALAYLTSQGVVFIDETPRFSDITALKHEMQAQNLQGVFQLLLLADESKLRHAGNGLPLHNWVSTSPGASCSLLRVGYSDTVSNAYYIDAELSPAFTQPVPIEWGGIESAGLLACIAILPGVKQAPPPDFSYFAGVDVENQMLPPNQWPVPVPPKPEINVDEIGSTVVASRQALQTMRQTVDALDAAHQNILVSIGRG